jgi:etoposide-induced 2.4 mRNA
MINYKQKIKNWLNDFLTGIWDSFQILSVIGIISKNSKISNNILNCLLLNGFLFIGSMILYSYYIEPLVEYILQVVSPLGYVLMVAKYFYYIFWLIPLYLLCSIITSFWIDEIYYECLEKVNENENENDKQMTEVEGRDIVTVVSNQIERLLIIICFVVCLSAINLLSNFIPFMFLLKFVTLSILNSLYVFEYIVMQKYIFDYKTITHFIENKFFYFFGFGMLLTFIVNQINSVTVSSSIFLMAFPFFLIESVLVNKIRFKDTLDTDIKANKVVFFYPIIKLYDFGITSLHSVFRFLKNKKFGKKVENKVK